MNIADHPHAYRSLCIFDYIENGLKRHLSQRLAIADWAEMNATAYEPWIASGNKPMNCLNVIPAIMES